MNIKLLPLTILFCGTCIYAQEMKLTFNYDSAGNQVLKDMLCINCPQEEPEVVVEEEPEIIAEDNSEIEEEAKIKHKIIAYPNPVMNELHVDWIRNPNKQPIAVELYSLDNKQQQSYKISSTHGVLRLPFHGYSAGVYFLVVTYSNGEQQSFNILKK